MAMMKGGQLIAETLVNEKVPYVFGICGHGNVGILDALYDVKDRLQLVSPRHEQCAGHMADAYFRVKHRPVATLTSTGPGSANLVMSLATALSDSSAFMAITANVPTSQHNRAPFQELYKHNQADFAQVMRPVVKRAFQPSRVEMLPLALRQAMDTMVTGRPGPVNLDIPYNVFQEEADVEVPPHSHLDRPHRPGASDADIAAVLDLLAVRTSRCCSSARAQRWPRPGRSSPSCRNGSACRSSPRRTGWAAFRPTIRSRWASSDATAPTPPTRPAAMPTW